MSTGWPKVKWNYKKSSSGARNARFRDTLWSRRSKRGERPPTWITSLYDSVLLLILRPNWSQISKLKSNPNLAERRLLYVASRQRSEWTRKRKTNELLQQRHVNRVGHSTNQPPLLPLPRGSFNEEAQKNGRKGRSECSGRISVKSRFIRKSLWRQMSKFLSFYLLNSLRWACNTVVLNFSV